MLNRWTTPIFGLGRCWLGLCGILTMLAGCGTAGIARLQPRGGDWRIVQGQATWRASRSRPPLSGELVIASRSNGDYVFNFAKLPMPIVAGQTTATNWLIEFPARRWSFGGGGSPPQRFGWLYLEAALAGRPLPERFRFSRLADGGWRLENARSGELIEGYLAP